MRSYSTIFELLFSTCRTCLDLGTKRRQVSDVTSLAHLYLNFLIQLFHSLYLLTSFMAAHIAGLYFCGHEKCKGRIKKLEVLFFKYLINSEVSF